MSIYPPQPLASCFIQPVRRIRFPNTYRTCTFPVGYLTVLAPGPVGSGPVRAAYFGVIFAILFP
jgi:hypothetical protein